MILMGIINLTPDSFYGPSRVWSDSGFDADALQARIDDLLARGCSILDLGAVSTRPGAEDVSEEEEWRRLRPALRMAAEAGGANPEGSAHRGTDYFGRGSASVQPLRISIDTTRSGIVRRVFDEIGPFIVNDISAGEDDAQMLATVAELGLPYVAMHKRGGPKSMDALTDYPEGVTAAVMQYFREFEARAAEAGIADWILDPGFGFAKTSQQNWQLLRDLEQFRIFRRPILAGVADKRFTKDPLFNGGDLQTAERMAAQVADILRIH